MPKYIELLELSDLRIAFLKTMKEEFKITTLEDKRKIWNSFLSKLLKNCSVVDRM